MSSLQRIAIVGSSGHAQVVIDAAQQQGCYEIAGLLDDLQEPGRVVRGYTILGGVDDLARLSAQYAIQTYAIAIGDNWQRSQVESRIRRAVPQLCPATVVHPSAIVSKSAEIAPGSVVMPGAIVNAGVRLGRFSIINTGASIDHDSALEDFGSLAPGAIVAGGVKIGEWSAICLNACVAEKLTIGRHVVVGAGSVVLTDLPDYTLAFGTPARVIRSRTAGESYLRS